MRSKKAKGKRQISKGKNAALAFDLKLEIGNLKEKIFRIYFCLLPFAFCLLLYAAAFCLLLSCAFAQDRRDYTLFNGTRVYFSLDTDAPDTPSHLASRIQVSDLNSINRIVVDQKSGIFFGYTLKVEPIGSSNKYRVFLQPLSNEQVQKIKGSKWYEQAQIALDPKQKGITVRPSAATSQSGRKPPPTALTPVTRYPPPQTIDDGDSIAVDVLVNPTTETKLTDRITISSKDLPALTTTNKTARDFTLDDLELKVSNYRLFINNQMVTADKPQAGCAGPLIWFYVPKHGRFIFSIQAHPDYGFQKIATLDGNKISFSFAGNNYEWRSESPIINNGGKWNLWVLPDTQFQPDDEALTINPANNTPPITPVKNCCSVGFATNVDSLFNRRKPQFFYVAGEANNPGKFIFREGTTLRQAIAIAQGVNMQASPRSAFISRQSEIGNRQTLPVNIENIVRGKEADVKLMANDVIVIPRANIKLFPNAMTPVLTPELYADELLIKYMLVDLPGANLPDSKWEVSWQIWFISEAEENRVREEGFNISTVNGVGVVTPAKNPRPEDYPNKIALGSGLFLQSGLAQLKDRINIGNALAFKAKIPEHLQTKFASLMISYNVKIFDAQLNRTITRSGIWMTKPFDDDPNNPLRSIPRTMLHSNWYVTDAGEVFTSQEPRRTNSTKWVEEE